MNKKQKIEYIKLFKERKIEIKYNQMYWEDKIIDKPEVINWQFVYKKLNTIPKNSLLLMYKHAKETMEIYDIRDKNYYFTPEWMAWFKLLKSEIERR